MARPTVRLPGEVGDQVDVAVVVDEGDALPLGDCSDEQVGDAHCADAAGAQQQRL